MLKYSFDSPIPSKLKTLSKDWEYGINLWTNCRLASLIGSDISCKAYEKTLYQKYKLRKINCENFLEVIDNVYSGIGEKWIKVILKSAKKNYFGYSLWRQRPFNY